jgi:hypothetical protein
MDDTYVLIGLSVIIICCIYLFYLNFRNTREHENFQNQLNDMKFVLNSQNSILQNLHVLQGSPSSSEPAPSSRTPLATHISPEPANDISDNVDLELNSEDIDKINMLEALDDARQQVGGAELTADDLGDIDVELDDEEIENLGNVDERPTIQVVENVNASPSIKPDEVLELNIEDLDDLDVDDVEDLDVDDAPAESTKALTKQELLASSVKDLKVIAKNYDLSTRGSKDVLISSICKKLNL